MATPPAPPSSAAPAPVPPAGAPPAPPPEMPRLVATRLLLNGALGVALLGWVRLNTDWGEAAGTVLALGGIFSWLAVVGKLFDDERQKQLRRFLANWLFETRRAWCVTAVLGTLLLLTAAVGSVEVANQKGGDVLVKAAPAAPDDPAAPAGPEPPDPIDGGERLAVGSRDRTLVFVSPFRKDPAKMTVKATGLPSRDFEVRPWWQIGGPTRVVVPGSFLRPVVLVLGVPGVLDTDPATVPGQRLDLVVTIDGVEVHRKRYDGRAVAIGSADPGLRLPLAAPNKQDAEDLDKVRGRTERLFPVEHKYREPLEAGKDVRATLYSAGEPPEPFAFSRPLRIFAPLERDEVEKVLFLRFKKP